MSNHPNIHNHNQDDFSSTIETNKTTKHLPVVDCEERTP